MEAKVDFMTSLTIEMPDELVRGLEGLAAAEHKSVQHWAVERLSSLVEVRTGDAAAILRAMREAPHVSAADVDELDAAISTGRLPVPTRDLFAD
jgi:predicted transcriptional regulator